MAQKAYEANGKSSPLPAPLQLPFPPGYVPPPVSNGTGSSRRGTLTTWARSGDYRRMARNSSLLQPRHIVILLAPCLHLARFRQWGPEGGRCARENQRTNPAPPPPHRTPAAGRERKRQRGDRPVPREQEQGARAAGNAARGEEAESQADPGVGKKKKHNAVPCTLTAQNHATQPVYNCFAPCAPVVDRATGWGGARARTKRPPKRPVPRNVLASCSHRARPER